jgi:hypothetical protein
MLGMRVIAIFSRLMQVKVALEEFLKLRDISQNPYYGLYTERMRDVLVTAHARPDFAGMNTL